MSSFCGFVGKTEKVTTDKMVKSLVKNCDNTPICFSDGYFHLGFVPFSDSEEKQIAHNVDFTIWAIADLGYTSKGISAEQMIERYEEKGIAFLEELDGNFAIVLWDGIRKKLYLTRDIFGAKPLFYAKCSEGIAFSSEIKALLTCDNVASGIHYESLYQYMSFGSVYTPDTVFEAVKHVSPGTYGVYGNGTYEEIRYCSVAFDNVSEDSYDEAALTVENLLRKSVEKCVCEEHTGIFLSGGLDSSLVAALAPAGTIKEAFCLRPITGKRSIHKKEEDAYFSEHLAKQYGMRHHVVDMTPQDLLDSMDAVVESFCQPFSGTVSTYFLAKEASGICKRFVTGDGADELFGSYRHHMVTIPMEKYAWLKEQGISVLGREALFAPFGESVSFLNGLYQYGGKNDTLWYYRLLQMGDGEKGIFLNEDVFGEYLEKQTTLKTCILWDKHLKSSGVLNRSLERDFSHLLPGHTMLYQDTLSRAYGINLAMPFMNKNLVDYVITLPQEYKIKEGITKAVLRETGRRVLPEEILKRRKEPFTLPVNEWLKSELKEFVTDVLCENTVKKYGLLNAECVQYALREFYKYPETKAYYAGMLWTMAMLQKWAMLYM